MKQLITALVAQLGLGNPATDILSFWIYDSLKILFLMVVLFLSINYLQTFLTPQRMSTMLNRKGLVRYPLASFFGILSPFCSCSTIPLFLGFLRAGVSLGATLTFLLTSPLVNLVAIPILWTVLGWKITLLYTVVGITLGIVSGYLIEQTGLGSGMEQVTEPPETATPNRMKTAYRQTLDYMKRFTPYVLAGTAIGAVIHGYLPTSLLQNYATGALAIPIAVLLAVPVYTNVFAVIPVVESLLTKGLPVEVAIVFLMSAAGVSLPEFVMLSEVMDKKLLGTLIGVVTAGIILIGYLIALL